LTDSILRVAVSRGPGQRGYSVKNSGPPTIAMTLSPLPESNPDEPMQWTLVTSPFRVPASDALSSFKTSSKILNVLARAEAEERGADEALLLNTNGEVAETAGGNLFWIYRDQICTVPTGRGVLPGITRAVVLEICQALGFETNKRVIKPEMLRSAEGIFITTSALGIVPVVAFDGEPVAPSPLVDQIAMAYHEMLLRE
jgi:branched-chain amino acid aminotransferase